MYCPNCGAPDQRQAEKCTRCNKLLPRLSAEGELIPALEIEASLPPISEPLPANRPAQPGQPGSQYSYGLGSYAYGGGYNQTTPWYHYGYPAPVAPAVARPLEAGFWLRLGAFVIDWIIVSLIFGFVFILPTIFWYASWLNRHLDEISPICDPTLPGFNQPVCNQVIERILYQNGEITSLIVLLAGLGGLALLLSLLYSVWMTARGATLGKRAFGLRVIRQDGTRPGFGRALLRQTVGYLLSSFFWLGFIWIGLDPKKQGWHDKIARTYVIRAFG